MTSFTVEDLTGACDNPYKEELLPGLKYSFIDRTNLVANCYINECNSSVNATGMCDPKIFISWIGTDKNGDTLISASNKLSNFEKYNMKGMFSAILNVNTNNHSDPDKPVRYDSSLVDADVNKRLETPTLVTADDGAVTSGSSGTTDSNSGTTTDSTNGGTTTNNNSGNTTDNSSGSTTNNGSSSSSGTTDTTNSGSTTNNSSTSSSTGNTPAASNAGILAAEAKDDDKTVDTNENAPN